MQWAGVHKRDAGEKSVDNEYTMWFIAPASRRTPLRARAMLTRMVHIVAGE
jgi:hypothetical protein